MATQPFYVLIDHNQNVVVKPVGESSVDEFLSFLNTGVSNFEKAQTQAQPQTETAVQ